jgi:hypothetical protein
MDQLHRLHEIAGERQLQVMEPLGADLSGSGAD